MSGGSQRNRCKEFWHDCFGNATVVPQDCQLGEKHVEVIGHMTARHLSSTFPDITHHHDTVACVYSILPDA